MLNESPHSFLYLLCMRVLGDGLGFLIILLRLGAIEMSDGDQGEFENQIIKTKFVVHGK